jgi:hypothetical protein
MSVGRTGFKIFISYARQDQTIVERLYEDLRSRGFDAWLDTKDLLPGANWKTVIRKTIRECPIFLACLSNASISKRGTVQEEINEALDVLKQKLDDDIYFVPVRLDDCEVPDKLSGFHWVDYFQGDGLAKLENSLRSQMRRLGVAPEEALKEVCSNASPSSEKLNPKTGIHLKACEKVEAALSHSVLALGRVLNALLEATVDNFGYQLAMIYLADFDNRTIGPKFGKNVAPELFHEFVFPLDGSDVHSWIVRSKQPIYLDSWDARFDRRIFEEYRQDKFDRCIIPISIFGNTLGTLDAGAYRTYERRTIVGQESLWALYRFVTAAGLMMERAFAPDQVQEHLSALVKTAPVHLGNTGPTKP